MYYKWEIIKKKCNINYELYWNNVIEIWFYMICFNNEFEFWVFIVIVINVLLIVKVGVI